MNFEALTLLVCLGIIPVLLEAYSSGFNVECNSEANYGCNEWAQLADQDDPNVIDRHTCIDPDKGHMDWVKKPVRSNWYTVRTGDGELEDVITSYVPDEYVTMYVRSLEFGHRLRGLMIHANTEADEFVGTWDIPDDTNPTTHIPCSDPAVLLHTSAELKPYRLLMRWKAPPSGTGTVTFKTLIKDGQANEGEFYFPEVDLVLTEAEAESKYWVESEAEETCHDTCERHSKLCSDSLLELIDTASNFDVMVANEIPCNLPFIGTCGGNEPVFREDGYCTFYDSSCQDNNTVTSTCATVTSNIGTSARLCPCYDASETDPGELYTESGAMQDHDSLGLGSLNYSGSGTLVGGLVGAFIGIIIVVTIGFLYHKKISERRQNVLNHHEVKISRNIALTAIQLETMSKPTPPAGSEPIPWETYTDDAGTPYYYNTETKETTWHMPAVLKIMRAKASREGTEEQTQHKRSQSKAPKVPKKPQKQWEEFTDDETGQKYYVNSAMNKTTWTKPADFW